MAKPLSIILKAKISPLIKFGFILQGVLIFLAIAAMTLPGLSFIRDMLWLGVLVTGAGFLFFFVSKSYFENIFFTEKIIVTYSTLTVIHKTPSKETKYEFSLRDVLYLGFSGTIPYTEQSITNASTDTKRLLHEEKELRFLIDEGNIELETESRIFRFGKNMSSRDTENFIRKIESHLGRKFISKNSLVLYE